MEEWMPRGESSLRPSAQLHLPVTDNMALCVGTRTDHRGPWPGRTSATRDKPRGRASVPRDRPDPTLPIPVALLPSSHLENMGDTTLIPTGPSSWAGQMEFCGRKGGYPDIRNSKQIQRNQPNSKNDFPGRRVFPASGVVSAVRKNGG